MEKSTSSQLSKTGDSKLKTKSDERRERFGLEKSKSNVGQEHAKLREDKETFHQRSSSLSDKSSDFDPSVYEDSPSEKSIADSLETMPIVFIHGKMMAGLVFSMIILMVI